MKKFIADGYESFDMNEKGRKTYFVKERFSVNCFDRKIGFYRQFSDDIMKQREEREDFFDKINEILNNIRLKCEISFISNERDVRMFNQNESVVLND